MTRTQKWMESVGCFGQNKKRQFLNNMADLHNIFISHYGEDEKSLDSLKQRLRDHGCDVRNSSVEKKKYRPYKVTDATIARYLRLCIRWAKTFIVMIGEHTHERPWVNYEIRQAARHGKTIVGVYMHGCKDDVELPGAFKEYGGTTLGWNSTDKLIDVIDGKLAVNEKPDGMPVTGPTSYPMKHIVCK